MLFSMFPAAREREKAAKAGAQKTPASPKPTPKKAAAQKGTATPAKTQNRGGPTQQDLDIAGLHLGSQEEPEIDVEIPKVAMAREKLLEEVASMLALQQKESPAISLVVIGKTAALSSIWIG